MLVTMDYLHLPPSPSLSNLPSFPTRRSSDLVSLYEWSGIGEPTQFVGLRNFGQALTSSVFYRAAIFLPGILSLVASGLIDRKSTRLNSSHVSISYAVFCLKKKKLAHVFGFDV